MNISRQPFTLSKVGKSLRLQFVFAMSLTVTNAYALQSCFNLPRGSAAYFACESLNQQERFINEQRERQAKEDLDRRYHEFIREDDARREKERLACADKNQCYYFQVNSPSGSPQTGPFSTSGDCKMALERFRAEKNRIDKDEHISDCFIQ